MKIVLASGTPYLPQVRGGVEVNTHELATELIARGHKVSVLTRLSYRDSFGVRMQLSQGLFGRSCRDDALGYDVFRARRPAALAGHMEKPDVVVIQNGHPAQIASAFARLDVPVLAYLHGLGFEAWSRQSDATGTARLPITGYLSISDFTARRFAERHGIATRVIPPIHRPERYRTEREPRYVTFINPVPVKGVDLALEIAARCPEIPFCLVKGWPLGVGEARRLKARMARLPNVTFLENADMRSVYRLTRILLVPSQWEAETWGRVATEAHYSGIPVVASDRGGLPESVGPGGIILGAQDPPEQWAAAIDRLWRDDEAYRAASEAALAHSKRKAIAVDHQISAFEDVLSGLVTGSRAPAFV